MRRIVAIHSAFFVIAAGWFATACSDGDVGSTCDSCKSGEVCDSRNICRRLCGSDRDCGSCESCAEGLCLPGTNCDPCDSCRSDQVCYNTNCMPACDPSDRTCRQGFECLETSGVEFCAPVNGIAVQGAKWDAGAQQLQGGAFKLRGGQSTYGGQIDGGSFSVTNSSE